MLDNLQHRYLLRLECANEAALEGKLDECRNICWELRLKSDDSLYTRAMVNLTLIDVCPIEEYPDKLKFAEEALRLAEMLQKEEGADKEAGWLEKVAMSIYQSISELNGANVGRNWLMTPAKLLRK